MRKAKLIVTFEHAPSYEVRIGAGALSTLGPAISQALARREAFLRANESDACLHKTAACLQNDGCDELSCAGETPSARGFARIFLLADDTATKEILHAAKESLSRASHRITTVHVCADDALATVGELWQALAQAHFASDDIVVALGDTPLLRLAGFVAATYSGGLSCVYAPTTLEAAICASVSDEAMLDVSGARNSVRATICPLYSCVDLEALASGTPEQWLAGFAELAQTAFLDSDDFFFWLWDNVSALRNRSAEVICEALVRALRFRSGLSAVAEHERRAAGFSLSARSASEGLAAGGCLRYGREFAFAAGASLAQGMRFSALLSQFKGMIAEDIVRAQDALLASLGFIRTEVFQVEQALDALLSLDGNPDGAQLVLPVDVGCCERVFVPADELRSCLEVL